MSSQTESSARRLGRPPGGGNEPEQAKEALLDAAERSLVKHGYRASTMAVIAEEAGYTRTMAYRHFGARNDLIEALVCRITLRQVSKVAERTGEQVDRPTNLATQIVEGLVIISTELARNPLYITMTERTENGSVAQLFVNAPPFIDFLVMMINQKIAEEGAVLRPGLRVIDAAKFLLGCAVSMLLGVATESDDPDQVRRYVATFILPAVLADPPPPASDVFPLRSNSS